jgi:probable phosphoglycerate mutase
MAAEIYLVRHGETEWNREHRLQGRLDSPLTPQGRAQAHRAGRLLARLGVGSLPVFVSPLGRTRATLAILGEETALGPVTVEPRLIELSLGSWDGQSLAQIQARRPDLLAGTTTENWYFRAPDGESLADASQRLGAWLGERNGPVIAVSHGMAARVLRAVYLSLPPEAMMDHPLNQNEIWHFHQGTVTELLTD